MAESSEINQLTQNVIQLVQALHHQATISNNQQIRKTKT